MKKSKLFVTIIAGMVFIPYIACAFDIGYNIKSVHSVFDENNTQEVKVTPEDCTTDDQFGHAVDVSGGYAIVGAYGNDDRAENAGAAYMLHFDSQYWRPIQKLSAIDGDEYDFFGYSVSIDGNHVIVGAYGDDDHGSNAGSAYIFTRDGNFWYEHTKLKAQDSKPKDRFGCSVDISGKYMIVGAYGARDNGPHSGAAYIFVSDSNGVYQQQKLVVGDSEPYDFFGHSVSISGDYAIVGAYGKSYHGERSGVAYIFKRMGRRWRQLIKLTPSDGAKNDYFGRSVSISGQFAIIGAIGKNSFGKNSGAAYIFKRSGFYWSRHATIIPNNVRDNYCFGASVNVSNGHAVIGAHGDNMNGTRTGAAYVYQLDHQQWKQIAMFRPRDGSDDDFFGCSVAISGSQIIAGAYGNDENGEKSGAAYLYGLFSSYVNANR